MTNSQNSFILYTDSFEEIQLLTMEQRGLLLTTAFCYVNALPLPELDQATSVLWQTWKKNIDRNAQKWEATRQRRSAAGRKGGLAAHRQSTAMVSNAGQALARKAVTDTDTVTVTDTGTVTETETETVTDTVNQTRKPPGREANPNAGNVEAADLSALDHFGTVL